MNALPYELRSRVVEAYHNGEGTHKELAVRFKISEKTVFNLLDLYRRTNSVTPKDPGGGQLPKIRGENLQKLLSFIEKNNDLTLEILCEWLERETKIQVCIETMSKTLERANITLKKKRFTRQSKKATE
jgi:transposase